MKRGEVSVQFNWMFVLFIGGLLLVLVFSIVSRTKENATMRVHQEILDRVAALLVNAEVGRDTDKETTIVTDGDLTLECSYASQRLRLGDESVPLDSQIVFGPASTRGPVWLTLARSVEWPFHIDNLVYFTSQNVYYLVLGNDQLAQDILGLLPKTRAKDRRASTAAIPTNIATYDEIRVISTQFTPLPSIPQEYRSYRQRLSLVAFDVTDPDAPGKAKFYVQNAVSGNWLPRGSSLGVDVFTMPSIIAAAVASGPDEYTCGMQRMWGRANLVGSVLRERSLNLTQGYDDVGNSVCRGIHQAALYSLGDFVAATHDDYVVNKIQEVSSLMADLELYNADAVRNSCARIY